LLIKHYCKMTKKLPILTALFLSFFICLPAHISAQVSVTATSGTATGSYTTLKAAFDKINDGTHRGIIAIKLSAGTKEDVTAVLNASGSGSANYTSVTLYPTVSGVAIHGNIAGAPLIDFYGADFTTIDGRVNATGSTVDMKLENTSTSATNGTSTVRYSHDALGNTLQFCYVLGSSMSATAGILYFGPVNGIGNTNNMVINCNISNSKGNRPLNALYSSGTNGVNSQNALTSNNFYDFFNTGANSYGINLGTGNSDWSIYYNSFYESSPFTPAGNYTYYGISVNNSSGTLFNISNNFIGGSASNCSGTFTKNSATDNVFYGVYLNAGGSSSSDWSNINGNTIKNITWTNSGNAAFYAIDAANAYINIGTAGGGNTIGAASGSGSITYTAGADQGSFYGINYSGSNVVSIAGNIIGAITANNSVSQGTKLYGIYCAGSNTGTGNTISGNTVVNLLSNATGANTLINGIYVSSGKNSVTENSVSGLTDAGSNNTASNQLLSAGGIVINNSTESVQTLTGNTIHGISNTRYDFAGHVAGIYYSGPSIAGNISGNFIYDIAGTGGESSGSIYGIKADAGPATWANNIISLSSNTRSYLYGFYDNGGSGNNHNIYFNTIYFSVVTGFQRSVCYYSASNNNTRDIRNNIFFNPRSGNASGIKQYGVYYASTGSLTTDYNDYLVTGTYGYVGYYDGADRTTLPDLKSAIGQDGNSLATNPDFVNGGSSTASDYYPQVSLSGVSGTGITTDYSGLTRASTPSMGAVEGQAVVTWTGGTSVDWSVTTNWDRSMVPLGGQNVAIPSGTAHSPHVTTASSSYSECNKLTIQSGATLTIDAGKALTVYGTLTNNAGNDGLLLMSSASGTAQLIHYTTGVNATVQRYIPAPASWADGDHGWHFLSAPVSAQAISTAFTVDPPENYDFYAWYEPNDLWVNYKNNSVAPTWSTANVLGATIGNGNFIPGKGYLTAYKLTSTKSFVGTLNVSDIPISGLTNTGSASYKGWNLLGNPFPCPIAWNNTGGGWALSNIDANCQIWDETNASYHVITPGNIIPVTNGFMVHVTNPGSGSLTIPASARRLTSDPWYKSGRTEENRIVLKAVDAAGQTAQETIIAFNPEATEGFDPLYDSYFLAGYAPLLYSTAENENYALNTLPGQTEEQVIPMGFVKNGSDGFSIELIENGTESTVYLTDIKTNTTQNLSNNPIYAFTAEEGDNPNRFLLQFKAVGIDDEPALGATLPIMVWNHGNLLTIGNPEQHSGEILAYNITGQTVLTANLENITKQTISHQLGAGIYVVQVNAAGKVKNQKIIVR